MIDTDDTQIGSTVHQVIAADAPLILSGHTYKEFKIQDTMTEGLTFLRVTRVAYGIAVEGNKLSQYSGYTNLVNNTDYRVTVASDKHSFDVNLTDTALAKLDNASAGSKVIVEFDAELNSKAQVGPDATKNQNHPTLYWRNSNTLEHQVDGTPVKLFTYEIDLKKEGLTTPANATFNVTSNNQTVNFTKESDGIYHVFSASDDNPSAMVSTIAPAAGGVLKIKGLDSHKYTFTEVSTQVGYNLLRSTFDVTLTANSPVDGNLTSAVLTAEGNSIDILSDKGIASLSVVNSKSVTLRTGGSGNAALYAAGLAVLIGAVASGISANRSRTEDKKTLARGRRH